MPKTHEQQAADPAEQTEAERRHRKRMADLCRQQPAVFVSVVRHEDHWLRQGLDRAEAERLALEAHGLAVGRG